MRGPYVVIRPKACCGRTRQNKFYRTLLGDLPKDLKARPGVKIALHRLPEVLDHAIKRMRSTPK